MSRREQFELTRPDGVVVAIDRDIDTGEQTVTVKPEAKLKAKPEAKLKAKAEAKVEPEADEPKAVEPKAPRRTKAPPATGTK